MDRFKFLIDSSVIKHAEHRTKEYDLNSVDYTLLANFMRKYGQWQAIVVAKVGDEVLIVDGDLIFNICKWLGINKIACYDLGELSRKDYVIARLFLTSRQPRLNYLGVAQAVKEIAKTERDVLDIANGTHISYEDVKRYRDLLDFDWEKFMREPEGLSSEQIKMFEDHDRV